MTDQFNPDAWLTSMFDALTDYINGQIALAVQGKGADVYDVVMSYPDADSLPKASEFKKTIIHLDIDDIDNKALGFGPGVTKSEITEGDVVTPGTVVDFQARRHQVNFDVGVWASDISGGITSRLRAYQILDKAFNGEIARERCKEITGGVDILFYNGGRFVTETISDVRVFRLVGAELEVRVYSRDTANAEILVDGEPTQQPDLEIINDSGSLVPLTDDES